MFTDGVRLYTRNLQPGVAVYGERLVEQDGVEYRAWNPRRSKLAALLKKDATSFPFARRSSVLYLGAADGTTVSHVSDVCTEGIVYAVEVSPRSFRKLIRIAENRPNLLPILGDATRPETYAGHVGRVDTLYQDVAQRDQVGIFAANAPFLRTDGQGILMAKSRSADVAARPADVFRAMRRDLEDRGFVVLAEVPLEPFERDHRAFLMERTVGP